MIALPELYAHQQKLRDDARAGLLKHGRIILCAQTGVGKTRIAKWILGAAANRVPSERASGNSLFTVHRRGLVDNAVLSFAEEPRTPHGVIMSGRETAYGRRIQIASIDTLLSWFVDGGKYPSEHTFDLLVFDECHSNHSRFARFLKYHDERREQLGQHRAYVIGLSATPRAKGLADVYGEIIQGPSTEWLIEQGYLSPFRYFGATRGKLDLLVKRGEDYTDDSKIAAFEGLAGDVVRDWQRLAAGRPTLGFFQCRSHAKEAMELLAKAGLRVAYVDGDTLDGQRITTFRDLNEHRIDYLCNVQVVERGTDIPAISCVQLCVATASVARYRQMIGRGARIHPEKKDCLILDHGGNVLRHGLFDDDPAWSLDWTKKDPGEQAARPRVECPRCQAIYRGGTCRHCGYEPPKREARGEGLSMDSSAEMHELSGGKKELKKKTPEQLMISSLYRAGKSNRTWKQAVGMYYRACEEQGTKHRVPKFVVIAGQRYAMLERDSPYCGRRVKDLFPFTVGGRGGEYAVSESINTQEVF